MTLDDLVIKHLRELLKLEDSAVKGLLSVYREESKRLLDEIELTPDDTFRAQYLRQILAQVEAGVAQMEARVAGRLAAESFKAQEVGLRHAQAELAKGLAQFPAPIPTPSSAALEAVYAPIINLPALVAYRENSRLSLKRWAGGEAADIQRTITKSILEYKTPRQIRRELEQVMGPKAKAHEIERIARTEFRNAAQLAYDEGNRTIDEEFPELALMNVWDARLDRSCSVCRRLNGQQRAVGQDFVDPATGKRYARPTVHPNCHCALRVWRKGWDKFKGL